MIVNEDVVFLFYIIFINDRHVGGFGSPQVVSILTNYSIFIFVHKICNDANYVF